MSNITKLSLFYVPLEADYKHTLYFSRPEDQTEYFNDMAVYSDLNSNDYSYQRKDHKIRVQKNFDELSGKVNYVRYNNSQNGKLGKWYYAFITNMVYVNDAVTDVYIKTDVMQTWMFDYELKSCFVEREHTDYDKIGANTIPEGLETGEFICNNVIQNKSTDVTCYVIASSVNLYTRVDSGVRIYNGVLTGWFYYVFDTKEEVKEVLSDIATLRTNDAIVNMFIMPKNFIGTVHKSNSTGDGGTLNTVAENEAVAQSVYWDTDKEDGSDPIIIPSTVNGYTPKNKKLLTYPYSYLLMDNNSGGTAVYKYELFDVDKSTDCCRFVINGCITPSGAIRLIPLKYNGVDGENHQFGLNGGKFPICAWQTDYYVNWLTQNALNLDVQRESLEIAYNQGMDNMRYGQIGDAVSAVGSAFTFNYGQAASSLGNMLNTANNMNYLTQNRNNQIKGIIAQQQAHAFQSPTVSGNTNSGDINYCMNNTRFTAYQMSVKREFAEVIDCYFSMYGYQTNRVKIPNSDHTKLYWYTKTVGCELDGAIPNEDIQQIKACYDNGITFWRNAEDIGRYTEIIDGEEILRDNVYPR